MSFLCIQNNREEIRTEMGKPWIIIGRFGVHVSTAKCLMENNDLIDTVGHAMLKIMMKTL